MARIALEVTCRAGIRQLRRPIGPARSLTLGDLVILAFLTTQALDGVLTYIGIMTFGPGIEGNPLLAWLMGALGEAPALTGAKIMSAGCGIFLHLAQVHAPVAALTGLYLGGAILPWSFLLFA